ncbi:PAS domain S-box protein [Natrinema zhouii]|uniref:histidine kinase n=1 Tax=Natrinema zhouii TaxID=1710539 RepID=A0A7D6GJL3_9EURY|nr:PAS domain S-box protein [Natrinema zhouii]QLK25359.1 PAS domain S-box protein [Natrinema zhouii]
MSRPRVLCVSGDRSTRASITLSLTDTQVDIVIAQQATAAIHRLEREAIDAVVIDASTVADVPTLVRTVESEAPGTPTFVSWGTGDDGSVLSEVAVRADETATGAQLADAIIDSLQDETSTGLPSTVDSNADDSALETGTAVRDLPAALADLVSTVRCRLVDATSPLAVERVLREELTSGDQFTFAWVGEYDPGEREIVPWLSDPGAMAWSLQRTFGIGDGEYPLLERVIRTKAIQCRRYDEDESDTVPFGDHAFERGARSVAIAPLGAGDELYGVVVIYATDPISTRELDAIQATAATASHVLETIAVRGRLDQRERALHRYERLVETAGDGMYVLDDAGHFTTVNDALVEITGYSREGLLGEHASILFHPDDVSASSALIRSLLKSEKHTETIELPLETKAGETIPCEAQIAVLLSDGTFLGSVGVLRDITERKRSERKLRERNERLDTFARIVSHDLRNPLGVAQGYLELFEESRDPEHADKTREGLDRMEAIIEDVLAIAREGEWAADTVHIDLESIAREAWDHVSTADATLSVTDTMTLDADRSRLLRLLENCFRNSLEHGDTTGTVRVGTLESAEQDGRKRGFFIEDDGDGLPAELREELFDPSVSSSSEGLGIGLWIVREVATGHGWSVVATESESGGARFEFETGV